jgi:3-oxoadipate enol-lactonase
MKTIISLSLFVFIQLQTFAKADMEKRFIKTRLGSIAVFVKDGSSSKIPLLFLHGVYLDHTLWEYQIREINDRAVFAIDMPWHGESQEGVPMNWTLDDCAAMVKEILDSLKVSRVIAVGHSWGSMTLLRVASNNPERFSSIGFCNMPFEESSKKAKRNFGLQHSMLFFKSIYIRQTAKVILARQSVKDRPELLTKLQTSMRKVTNDHIKRTDRFVIIDAKNTSNLILTLKVPSLALKGKEDYVPAPTGIYTEIVGGGHISPWEAPRDVSKLIQNLILIAR